MISRASWYATKRIFLSFRCISTVYSPNAQSRSNRTATLPLWTLIAIPALHRRQILLHKVPSIVCPKAITMSFDIIYVQLRSIREALYTRSEGSTIYAFRTSPSLMFIFALHSALIYPLGDGKSVAVILQSSQAASALSARTCPHLLNSSHLRWGIGHVSTVRQADRIQWQPNRMYLYFGARWDYSKIGSKGLPLLYY